MNFFKLFGIWFFAIILSSPRLFAQYFPYSFQSSRSMALGGVSSTGFDEAFTTLLNPASLTKLSQNRIALNSQIGITSWDFESKTGSIKTDDSLLISPGLAAGFRTGSSLIGLGLSISSFDNLRMKFPENEFQRYQLNEFALQSGSFDVGLGFMPRNGLSFGLRVGYRVGMATWERMINPFEDNPSDTSSFEYTLLIDGEDFEGLNGEIGMIWSPNYRFEIGLSYQPTMSYHFDSDIEAQLPPILGGATLSSGLEEIRVNIPMEAILGIHWIASERVDCYFDVAWKQYSSIDDIEIKAKKPITPFISETYKIPVDYRDELRIHTGFEIIATPAITLRFGGYYASPVSEDDEQFLVKSIPDRFGFTSGIGFELARLKLDLAGGYNLSNQQKIHNEMDVYSLTGDLESSRFFINMGVSWTF